MQVPVELLINTILTGIVAWIVKAVLDKLKEYQNETTLWRVQTDDKIDKLADATKADMRINLVYSCEKSFRRGWTTSEELASIQNLYNRYDALDGHNGFIQEYMERLRNLEIRKI